MRAPPRMCGSGRARCSSTPCRPATTTSASPSAIAWAPAMTAFRPEPQTLLRVVAGTVSGMPAKMAAWRAGAWPTPAWSTQPMMTSLDLRRRDARALERRLDGDRAELRRGQRRQRPLEGPDGGTRRAHDDDFTSHSNCLLEELAGGRGPITPWSALITVPFGRVKSPARPRAHRSQHWHVTRTVKKQTAGLPEGTRPRVCPSSEGRGDYFFSLLAITSPRRALEPSAWLAEVLAVVLALADERLHRQRDLPVLGVDVDDLHLDLLALLHDVAGVLDALLADLGDVHEALDARLDLDEGAEVGDLDDLALDDGLPTGSALGERVPRVRLRAA